MHDHDRRVDLDVGVDDHHERSAANALFISAKRSVAVGDAEPSTCRHRDSPSAADVEPTRDGLCDVHHRPLWTTTTAAVSA
jgi:hypothetical protein